MKLSELQQELKSLYPCKIELHAHTSPASGCSEVTPYRMAEIYHGLGYDALTITNHFVLPKDGTGKRAYIDRYFDDFEKTRARGDELGIRVYLGAEIRFTENVNDYLIFGVDRELLEEIYELLPFGVEHFRKKFSMPKSLFIQAHPMRKGIEPVDPSLLDGVEVYNMHPNHNSRVGLVSAFAKEKGISLITAGSDFHHPDKGHEGLCAIRGKHLPEDGFALAALLKERDYLIEIGGGDLILPLA